MIDLEVGAEPLAAPSRNYTFPGGRWRPQVAGGWQIQRSKGSWEVYFFLPHDFLNSRFPRLLPIYAEVALVADLEIT